MGVSLLTATQKKTVLVFVGYYRPGFKAGGILRSIENLVDHLHHEFEFRIVTRDRDLGDAGAYPDVEPLRWQQVGNAQVYYLRPADVSASVVADLIRATPHDLVYLNSFFEPLTIYALTHRLFNRRRFAPVVLAPRGEFAWASRKQKNFKKTCFTLLARMVGLYRDVVWQASSEFEAVEICEAMNLPRSAVRVAVNLPIAARQPAAEFVAGSGRDRPLRIVFLARIAEEKNLDFALRVLAQIRTPIEFDIIGPIDNALYWKKCETLLKDLPANVRAEYKGSIAAPEIMATLSGYDLLLFPSGGENYAHVIAESLACGTPVLTSVHTPWRELASKGLGWDLPLDDTGPFVEVVRGMADETEETRFHRREAIKIKTMDILNDPNVLAANRELFEFALGEKDLSLYGTH
jgi:glycosyltransferase involved in cell wall biosynthesis